MISQVMTQNQKKRIKMMTTKTTKIREIDIEIKRNRKQMMTRWVCLQKKMKMMKLVPLEVHLHKIVLDDLDSSNSTARNLGYGFTAVARDLEL